MGSHRVGHDWSDLAAAVSDFTFTFHFYALEKEMATHSSVLAWRIPGTGEPGGLPSMGLPRVGHDWSDLAAAAAAVCHFAQISVKNKIEQSNDTEEKEEKNKRMKKIRRRKRKTNIQKLDHSK